MKKMYFKSVAEAKAGLFAAVEVMGLTDREKLEVDAEMSRQIVRSANRGKIISGAIMGFTGKGHLKVITEKTMIDDRSYVVKVVMRQVDLLFCNCRSVIAMQGSECGCLIVVGEAHEVRGYFNSCIELAYGRLMREKVEKWDAITPGMRISEERFDSWRAGIHVMWANWNKGMETCKDLMEPHDMAVSIMHQFKREMDREDARDHAHWSARFNGGRLLRNSVRAVKAVKSCMETDNISGIQEIADAMDTALIALGAAATKYEKKSETTSKFDKKLVSDMLEDKIASAPALKISGKTDEEIAAEIEGTRTVSEEEARELGLPMLAGAKIPKGMVVKAYVPTTIPKDAMDDEDEPVW